MPRNLILIHRDDVSLSGLEAMLVSDILRISLRQIYRNRRRYRGAILGTALGIAGLITVVSMGDSVESMLGKNLEILGSATIVKCGWDYGSTPRWHHGEYSQDDVREIRRLPGVLEASPALWKRRVRIAYRKKNFVATIAGVEANFFETLHLPMAKGRRILESDEKQFKPVCVIGQTVEKELFGPEGASLGHRIVISGASFEVVGVLGGAEDLSYMESAFLPLPVVKAQFHDMHRIRDVYVRAQDWDSVPGLNEKVKALLVSRQPGYSEAMSVTYSAERIAAIKTVVFVFKFFLYASIAVTLVLGGLGITNVMLAVVNERTTEIGLRKAVGATEGKIMAQFLCESLAVSLAGAGLGILCGFWAVEILQKLFETEAGFGVFIMSICASVLIGTILGVASGMLPAARAGRLSAVDAMKFE
jgi:putative ABC transport system permease protein